MKKFEWKYCTLCDVMMVICPDCGNNTCNAGSGWLENGDWCGCEEAYQYKENNPAPPKPHNYKQLQKEYLQHLNEKFK